MNNRILQALISYSRSKSEVARSIIVTLAVIICLVFGLIYRWQAFEVDEWSKTDILASEVNKTRLTSIEDKSIIEAQAKKVILAIKNKDMEKLSSLVHPNKGIRFSPYTYIRLKSDLVFKADDICSSLLMDSTKYVWGTSYSGAPIKLTFNDYLNKNVYDKDFAKAKHVGYNKFLGRSNMKNNTYDIYPQAIVVEYHFPGFQPKYGGIDWESLRLIFEKESGTWFLVGISHGAWTP